MKNHEVPENHQKTHEAPEEYKLSATICIIAAARCYLERSLRIKVGKAVSSSASTYVVLWITRVWSVAVLPNLYRAK